MGEIVQPDVKNNGDQIDGGKRHVFNKNLHDMEDKKRLRQKWNLSKIKKKCKNCEKSICLNHRFKKVESGFLCEGYDLSWNLITFWRGFVFYTPKN